MADEEIQTDRPLAILAEKEQEIGRRHEPEVEQPDEIPAADRLRAFEDEHLGKDAVRIGGKIERGSGSPFAGLSPELKRQYAALEKLLATEQKLADAHAALIQADADHDAALAAAEPKPDADAGE
jgi:hypothetical protein